MKKRITITVDVEDRHDCPFRVSFGDDWIGYNCEHPNGPGEQQWNFCPGEGRLDCNGIPIKGHQGFPLRCPLKDGDIKQ